MRKLVLLAILVALPFAALGKEAVPAAKDPVLEQRLMSLAENLRCLVCQNQTLADSQSGLADDLRREIRGMMEKGMSDRQIVDFLVQRYGDFVRYKPPVKRTTALLWYGPGLALIAGLIFLIRVVRRRSARREPAALSDAERAQLNTLMTQDSSGGSS